MPADDDTTEDQKPAEGGRSAPGAGGGSSMATAARRYGPFVVIALVIGAVVVVLGGDGGGDGDGTDDGGNGADGDHAYEEVVRSGPMTTARADLEGVDVDGIDFGPHCDEETGNLAMPTVYAPPCAEVFDGDNGGATDSGVTEDTIKVVAYRADPDLDPMAEDCYDGDMAACDDLYRAAGQEGNVEYIEYGDTCAGRQPVGTGEWCVDSFG